MEYGADATTAMADEAGEYDPLAEFPRSSKPWLDLVQDAEKAFRNYQDAADNVDKELANLNKLRNTDRVDREYAMFWANMEVIRPSIYSRPPQPVVVPQFKDMRELPRVSSELMERTLKTTFDKDDIHDTLIAVRDDMAANARGVSWVRYEAEQDDGGKLYECVRFDHVDRKDFLHEPCRKWKECNWVARRSYLSMEDARARFGDAAIKCDYKEYKPEDGANYDGEKKTQVWEIWHKKKAVVVWVSSGVDEVLDVQEPFLTLEKFFPCPKPAYGTLQRGTMIPIPDFLYYKDQVEEINELTARISGLCESLRMKGFYASGEESLSNAIEKVLKQRDNSSVLVPVPAHLMAGQSMKDAILWLPVDQIAMTIKELIAIRKEVISDVYQITGISDIMRGDTNASETLGAQQLKSQYGSIRIKERQAEMIRVARDLTRIAAEIIAENFQAETLVSMSQMQLPQRAQVQMQQQQMQQQAMMAQQAGQPPQKMPPPPVTLEDVIEMIREQHIRPFVLDIETDSTIQPDENAEKQRANEFMQALGGFLGQAIPMVLQVPQSAPLATEALKFVASKFRAGRQLEGAIDKFAEQIEQSASQPKPNPEAEKMKHEMAIEQGRAQIEQGRAQADMAMKNKDMEIKQLDAQIKATDAQIKQLELQMKGYEAQAKVREMDKAENEPPEPQEDEYDMQEKVLRVQHSAVDLEGKKRALEMDGRKGEAEASDSEARAKHSESINAVAEKLTAVIDKLDQRQDKSEELIAQLVRAASAPKRGKRLPDGSMQIETVM